METLKQQEIFELVSYGSNKKVKELSEQEIKALYQYGAIDRVLDLVRDKKTIPNLLNEVELKRDNTQAKIEYFNCLGLGAAFRIIDSSRQARKRLNRRFNEMVKTKRAYFLTLQFSNDFVALPVETLAKYCKRFLNENCLQYVANIDYGENNRVHFHAVVVPKEKFDFQSWEIARGGYGYCYHEKIKYNSQAVAKYINKFSNHSLKNNGFKRRLIYSRQ